MEAIARPVGRIAHDFNNLLGVISAYLEIVEGQLGDRDGASEPLRRIGRQPLSRQVLLPSYCLSVGSILSMS
jgi:hypothetical protein